MYKCPQCQEEFEKKLTLIEHLQKDNRGDMVKAGKIVPNQVYCPSWPDDQIKYYDTQGLLEVK